MPQYSVVIPTLNEERSIEWVIREIPDSVRKKSEIIVPDASSDRTPELAERAGARVIRVERGGKGRQVRRGIEEAEGRILVLMDGDGEHPPFYIQDLIDRLKEGYDVVLGTRKNPDFLGRPALALGFILYLPVIVLLFRMVGLKLRGTPLTGFRCMRREVWEKLNLKSQNFLLEAEMNVRMVELGLRYAEVHIPYLERQDGIARSRVLGSSSVSTVVKYILVAIFRRGVRKMGKKGVNRRV